MIRVVSQHKRKCQSLEQVSSNLGDWYEVDEEKLVIDFRDEAKHTETQSSQMITSNHQTAETKQVVRSKLCYF